MNIKNAKMNGQDRDGFVANVTGLRSVKYANSSLSFLRAFVKRNKNHERLRLNTLTHCHTWIRCK